MAEYGWYRTKKLALKRASVLRNKKHFKKVFVKKVKKSPEGYKSGYKVYAYWR